MHYSKALEGWIKNSGYQYSMSKSRNRNMQGIQNIFRRVLKQVHRRFSIGYVNDTEVKMYWRTLTTNITYKEGAVHDAKLTGM